MTCPEALESPELSRDDVANQSRILLAGFIHERLQLDGYRDIPIEDFIQPGTRTGPPLEDYQELVTIIQDMAREIDGNENIKKLLEPLKNKLRSATNWHAVIHAGVLAFFDPKLFWRGLVTNYFITYVLHGTCTTISFHLVYKFY